MTRNAALSFVCGLLAAGCSLAPKYEQPTPAVPTTWPLGTPYPERQDDVQPTLGYRDLFRDPRLVALIDRAIANNQDVRLALANVAAARGLLRVRRGARLPQVDGSTSVTTGDNGAGRATNVDLSVGITAFEIDLFGRVKSLSDAALEDYLATEAAVRATRLTLVAAVSRAWLTGATDRSLLSVARETAASASRSVELTRARLTGGIAPRSDVRQAETVLAQARADVADLTTQVAQDRNALELLVGAPVTDDELAESIESVDDRFDALPAGLDSRVLLGRPDIMQAEFQLRAANARIGAARAAFFPTISLTAVAGFASTALSSLLTRNAFAWSLGPSASLPLFDAGVRRGNLEVAEADRDFAVATYQRAIQTAFREVADALARRGTIDDQVAAQLALEEAARDSNLLAEARYRGGVESFLVSLDAQRTLYSARRSLATVRGVRAANAVDLFQTVGGETR